MTRSLATIGLVLATALSACDSSVPAAPAAPSADTAPAAPAAPAADAAVEAAAPAAAAAATEALPGAPAFAALYPGAELDHPAAAADGPAGPGGMLTFTTAAAPDEVIAFYKARAEAAGLESAMAMNQGDARAYGAAAGGADGPSLQVVAAPGEAGRTSVQLSWSAGG